MSFDVYAAIRTGKGRSRLWIGSHTDVFWAFRMAQSATARFADYAYVKPAASNAIFLVRR